MFAKFVIKIEKRVGDKTQPCYNPNSWSNQSDSKSPNITLFSTFSYIFLSSLQHFPFRSFFHNNAKRPSRQTLSRAFERSKKAK